MARADDHITIRRDAAGAIKPPFTHIDAMFCEKVPDRNDTERFIP
ncbi:MAG: hypothetical protein ACR2OZ_18560 [Verrucomicrobiales bacterium]